MPSPSPSTTPPIFAWGGLSSISDEWGPVYPGATTNANEAVSPVHNRMPVLMHRDEYKRWMHGSLDEILAFQKRTFPADLMTIERTGELCVKKKVDAADDPLLL